MRKICFGTLARSNEIRCAGHILRSGEEFSSTVVIHIVGTGQRRGLVQNDFALEMSREKSFSAALLHSVGMKDR